MGNSASPTKRALICGVSGQDGAYLARSLLARGYEVWGTSRDTAVNPFTGLERLQVMDRVRVLPMSPVDLSSVLATISRARPNEIYNLAGQSSVALSFELPVETYQSISHSALNLLEAIRTLDRSIKLFNAGSSDCFGERRGNKPADESTPFQPKSPYAAAKAAAAWQVAVYRECYGLFACTGILFNHESPLRPDRFVTTKIASAVVRIAAGGKERLHLGNIGIQRDWGWAPEYVDAIWRMLQLSVPQDLVIATGTTISLESFVAAAFDEVGLDWREFTEHDKSLMRPSEIMVNSGNPAKAALALGWNASSAGTEIARKLVRAIRDQNYC